MRHIILSICASAALLPCFGQVRGRIGTGVTEMLTKEAAGIYTGHSISNKWSVESEAVFRLPLKERTDRNEWYEHNNEFADEDTQESSQTVRRFTLSLRHWQHSVYDGGCVILGITQYGENWPLIHAGVAYYMKICSHLGVDLSCRISLNGRGTDKAAAGGITLTIDYLF